MNAFLTNTPILGPIVKSIVKTSVVEELRRRIGFKNSSNYWEQRYRKGKSSGAGSYGPLAQFKAEVLNNFVAKNEIQSVMEFGCGDGAQLSLAHYPSYIGVDIAQSSIDLCKRRFANDPTKSFYRADQLPFNLELVDATLSLDVIYHLVEDDIFDTYMRSLFKCARQYVIIYSSNKIEPSGVPHVRHRKFTDWIEHNTQEWELTHYIPNRYPFAPNRENITSFADFYFFRISRPKTSWFGS
jgi:cyclopropane fatty-acyl-phospholipid synthase-like methyltransferase